MKKDEQNQCNKACPQQYNPVKPFAFEAWKIWNHLTTSAELLWEEYETDFMNFCCYNKQEMREKQCLTEDDPF